MIYGEKLGGGARRNRLINVSIATSLK